MRAAPTGDPRIWQVIKMKITVAGAGKIGFSIVTKLAEEGHDITVIEQDHEKIENAVNNLDVMVIRGNAATPGVLREADAGNADIFIAATGDDETNLVSCLFAGQQGAEHKVALLRNPEYMGELSMIKSSVGIDLVINPDLVTAEEISRVIRFPAAIQVESFPGCQLEIVTFLVPSESQLSGLKLGDLEKRFGQKVLVSCVVRNGEPIIPGGDFVLAEGDEVSVTGTRAALRRFSEQAGTHRRPVRKVMLLGGSRIAVHLTRILESTGIDVSIVEKDYERCLYLSETIPEADIICANGSDTSVLEENGLPDADGFVTLTSFDEDNIILAIYAQRSGVRKVVAKVNSERFIELLKNVFPDTIMSPRRLVTERMLGFVRGLAHASSGSTIEAMYYLADQKVQATEFVVGERSACSGIPLKRMKIRPGVLFTALIRNGKSYLPDGNTVLMPEDRVVIVCRDQAIRDIDGILLNGASV